MTDGGTGITLAGYGKRRGTLALSWGQWGGFYAVRSLSASRICLGWVALTFVRGLEIETLMAAWADQEDVIAL